MSKKEKEAVEEAEILEETAETEVEETAKEAAEESLEAKLREATDKYMRLYAEFDNYQKRTAREKDARYADAVIDVAAKIVPIGDNLERALQTEVTSEDAVKLKEGIRMVLKQFNDALAAIGVSEIAAYGEQFDPNFHNAVMHVEDESIDDNTVVEELMKGYKYKDDRVVRHSMVKVAN